ncbi:MAG TPA: arginine deiminase family protein, partial [Planctomycetota bacterium]|nr:arginine deiminase family protein [Planctomycetota bacterium]
MPDRRDLLNETVEPQSASPAERPSSPARAVETIELEVWSEIAPLRDVIIHTPGKEVDRMPPTMTHELLFDDIIDGERAREEHEHFLAVMRGFGVRVWDTLDLLAEALESNQAAVPSLIDDVVRLDGTDEETEAELRDLEPSSLARALVHGILSDPENPDPEYLFRLSPLPNLLFTRDPQVVLGDSAVISWMTHWARKRESLLARFIFERHPMLAGNTILDDFLEDDGFERNARGLARPASRFPTLTLEGGD